MTIGQPIRIGLLGASRIAPAAVVAPVGERRDFTITAVAARSADRARAFAKQHGVPGVLEDYAQLVSSSSVDLVYNALPPSEHVKWTLAALAQGKHVLCEKPFAMNAVEARTMVAAADDSPGVLIEAFHYRFHPLFDRILQLVGRPEFGPIKKLDAHFNVAIPFRAGELRHVFALGGGALMDLGCYPLHWSRGVFGAEPRVVSAQSVEGEPGIDLSMHALLDFSGVPAEIECDMSETLPAGASAALRVVGEQQSLHVSNPIAPHDGHQLVLSENGSQRNEQVAGRSTYWHQLDHVAAVIRGDAPALTGGADAIANMQAIDAIYEAARMRPRTPLAR